MLVPLLQSHFKEMSNCRSHCFHLDISLIFIPNAHQNYSSGHKTQVINMFLDICLPNFMCFRMIMSFFWLHPGSGQVLKSCAHKQSISMGTFGKVVETVHRVYKQARLDTRSFCAHAQDLVWWLSLPKKKNSLPQAEGSFKTF